MAITNTARKAENQGTGSPLNITLNSTAAGSLILVATASWGSSGQPVITVSDSVNGSYGTAAVSVAASNSRAAIFYFANSAGGNLTIGVTRSLAFDTWACAHEFAGADTSSPLSGTPVSTTGSGTTHTTPNLSPPDNDVLLASIIGHWNSVTAWNLNAGGQGFTLSNQWMPSEGGSGEVGCFVFKIVSGAPGTVNYSGTISGTSGTWVAGLAAFKPALTTPVYTQTKFRIYNDDGVGLGEHAAGMMPMRTSGPVFVRDRRRGLFVPARHAGAPQCLRP